MPDLFSPTRIGGLSLRNHLMRSATAERLADPDSGRPLPALAAQYETLARGGIGLIVTGHACVERQGKAHPQMSAIYADDLIPTWQRTIRPAQDLGARVMLQINHSGASTDPSINPDPIAPSGIPTGQAVPRAMTAADIERIVEAFGQGARRAREAGFDGVQLHGAHGYLTTQFLSPATNRRTDAWGGDPERRRAFLRAIVRQARHQVGDDYPLWIKLGVAGRLPDGLPLAEGAAAAATAFAEGIDCVEISHAIDESPEVDRDRQARYLPLARAVRRAIGPEPPLALVNGFATVAGMQAVLDTDIVQLISLCRPLIAEPDLPARLRADRNYLHACERCHQCWPRQPGEGVGCHNPDVLVRLEDMAREN